MGDKTLFRTMVKLRGRAWNPAPTPASTGLLTKIYWRGRNPVAGGQEAHPYGWWHLSTLQAPAGESEISLEERGFFMRR